MYQTSETGYSTLEKAIAAGVPSKADYHLSAQEAFAKYSRYIPIE
jgi:hypothetical protein